MGITEFTRRTKTISALYVQEVFIYITMKIGQDRLDMQYCKYLHGDGHVVEVVDFLNLGDLGIGRGINLG